MQELTVTNVPQDVEGTPQIAENRFEKARTPFPSPYRQNIQQRDLSHISLYVVVAVRSTCLERVGRSTFASELQLVRKTEDRICIRLSYA